MIYTLVLLAPPSSDVPVTALNFARSLLDRGHTIQCIFFLDNGVQCALGSSVAAQDDVQQLGDWAALASEHSIELVACVSSALRRGVLDAREAERHEKNGATLAQGFVIGGLGELIDAQAKSDRTISFGGQA